MDRFNATNHTWLQKLSLYDINIEGISYLNEKFSNGTVILDSLIVLVEELESMLMLKSFKL